MKSSQAAEKEDLNDGSLKKMLISSDSLPKSPEKPEYCLDPVPCLCPADHLCPAVCQGEQQKAVLCLYLSFLLDLRFGFCRLFFKTSSKRGCEKLHKLYGRPIQTGDLSDHLHWNHRFKRQHLDGNPDPGSGRAAAFFQNLAGPAQIKQVLFFCPAQCYSLKIHKLSNQL
ncbi:MAG: hypothetical protein HUJ55_02645 [Ileibacterium sp.]|nr:hypothetical protein [Ileibacterium sp.]